VHMAMASEMPCIVGCRFVYRPFLL
jgi:hypothetical protein